MPEEPYHGTLFSHPAAAGQPGGRRALNKDGSGKEKGCDVAAYDLHPIRCRGKIFIKFNVFRGSCSNSLQTDDEQEGIEQQNYRLLESMKLSMMSSEFSEIRPSMRRRQCF